MSVNLEDVPTRTDQEPKMRVPLPPGWERTTKMDNESIRFAIRNPALAVDGFTPNAVVTLQKVSLDVGKPTQILDAQNDQLAKKLKAKDLTSTPTEVCGAPAMSSSYTAPEMRVSPNPKIPPVPSRKATSLGAVYRGEDANYVATLTVQSVKPDDKTFAQDSQTILKGFQLLPPK
ncbi:LpqN/LpqT family lipoprotein [Mycolicibacterium sp.]|uniref:LpqN/LpqT family lipoprotein n=1 Tax=Mycolicibacterium sp. TaxID=2320850 RepID=UPI0025F0385C|nr:LpqN/LpqT family lipoprotein [Mycolicibacterium sp.]